MGILLGSPQIISLGTSPRINVGIPLGFPLGIPLVIFPEVHQGISLRISPRNVPGTSLEIPQELISESPGIPLGISREFPSEFPRKSPRDFSKKSAKDLLRNHTRCPFRNSPVPYGCPGVPEESSRKSTIQLGISQKFPLELLRKSHRDSCWISPKVSGILPRFF